MNIPHQHQRTESAKASLVFVLAFSVLIINCRPASNSSYDSNTQAVVSSTTPPFSTKEPELYRATRTTAFIETNANGSLNRTRTTNVSIMRDGVNRREDYETAGIGTIVFLESAAGRFVMLPQAKVYADTADAESDAGLSELKVESETVSPDFLLNESTVSSEYQKLGEEVRAGRITTKYRVLTRSGNPPITSETLIWVDETLGMPIASQFITNNANGSTKVLMELRDITIEVEPEVFALPSDYRKVAMSEILNMVRAADKAERSPAAK